MTIDKPKCLECKHYNKYDIQFSCNKYKEIPIEIIKKEKECEHYKSQDETKG